MPPKTVRTTISLPVNLMKAADQAILDGKAKSRNELVAQALRRELAALERSAIDAAFAEMANDLHYQREARKIADQFVRSDWEALQATEEQT